MDLEEGDVEVEGGEEVQGVRNLIRRPTPGGQPPDTRTYPHLAYVNAIGSLENRALRV